MAEVIKEKELGMEWYTDELLVMAKDLGYRLLPAFNTTTGIPFPRVSPNVADCAEIEIAVMFLVHPQMQRN